MHIRKQKRKNERIYLSVVQNYRTPEGKTRSKHIRSLGYLDELEKTYPDPIAPFQEEIDKDNAAMKAQGSPIELTLSPLKKINKKAEMQIEMGSSVPSVYFHRDLGIWSFFERKRTARKFSYDPCRILELLVWDRIAHLSSKKTAFKDKGRFPRKCDFSLNDVYRCLDYFALNSDALVKHMNSSRKKARGPRDTTRLYYDVTNYYFEMDEEDVGGLKKKDVSKEYHPEAIVQMGLLIDHAGIPLDFELFAGNVTDMQTSFL